MNITLTMRLMCAAGALGLALNAQADSLASSASRPVHHRLLSGAGRDRQQTMPLAHDARQPLVPLLRYPTTFCRRIRDKRELPAHRSKDCLQAHRCQRTVLQNGQMREQVEVLKHHADFAAQFTNGFVARRFSKVKMVVCNGELP